MAHESANKGNVHRCCVAVLTGGDFESVEKGPQFVPTPPWSSVKTQRGSLIPVSDYPIIHSQGLLPHLFPPAGIRSLTQDTLLPKCVHAHVYTDWLRSQMYLIGGYLRGGAEPTVSLAVMHAILPLVNPQRALHRQVQTPLLNRNPGKSKHQDPMLVRDNVSDQKAVSRSQAPTLPLQESCLILIISRNPLMEAL